jgi:hypothetical protein
MDVRHTISHLENRKRKGFLEEIRLLGGRGLHTNKKVAQISLGLYLMSRLV